MSDEALEAIHNAERIVWVAGWRLQEDRVLRQLASTRGLASARLEPRSEVIQLVTYDGEHLGHVRREVSREPEERWVAVLKIQGRAVGSFTSALAAAEALARACGKEITKRC